MFKNPHNLFLSISSCNQCVSFGHHQNIQVLIGKQADEGTSFCLKNFSLLEAFPVYHISFLLLYFSFPDFYFFVSLI